MKKYLEFIPRKVDTRITFFNNMFQKVTTVGAQLGLTPAEITDLKDLLQFSIDTINDVAIKRTDLDNALQARELLNENQIREIRRIVGRMKKSPQFNEAIGAQLGILGNAVSFDELSMKPLLKLQVVAGQVRISFKKKYMPGISIYSRKRGASGWTKIAQVNHSPFTDTRSLEEAGKPEAREYKALYHDGRSETGQESDVTAILTGTEPVDAILP